MGARLRKAANSMDKVRAFVSIVEEAEKKNPKGLSFNHTLAFCRCEAKEQSE
jgi:hypothetical protein